MGSVAGLASPDLGGLLELAFIDQPTEAAAAQHISALADDGRAQLVVNQQGVNAGDAGFRRLNNLPGSLACHGFAQEVNVPVDRAAAAANQVHPPGINEPAQRLRHGLRRFVILAVLVWHSGVGDTGHREAGNGCEGTDVVGHKCGAGGAVDADPQQVAVSQRHVEGLHVLAGQQGSHGLDGALHGYRNLAFQLSEGAVYAFQSRLDVQGVLPCFQQQHIHAAFNEPGSLNVIAVGQFLESDAAGHGDGLGGRPHGTRHEAGLVRRCRAVSHPPGQLRGHAVETAGLVGQIVLGQHDGGGSEGIGLDDVCPGVQMPLMDGFDDIRPGKNQMLVASLVFWAAEVVGAEVEGLDCRPHGAVNYQDALAESGLQGFDAFL